MKIVIREPENLSIASINSLLRKFGPHSKFIGSWSVRTVDADWSETPVDVVYVPSSSSRDGNPKLLGYFTKYMRPNAYVADVTKSFENPHICLVEDMVVYTSKYRHDFVKTPKGIILDGGKDYFRSNAMFANTRLTFDLEQGQYFVISDNGQRTQVDIEYDFS